MTKVHPLSKYYLPPWRRWAARINLFWLPMWSEFGKITSSRTITSLFLVTSIFPIVLKLIPPDKEYCVAFHKGVLCIPFELPFSWWLLYLAGLSGIFATVIYVLRAPDWVKTYGQKFDFNEINLTADQLHAQAYRYFDIRYDVEAFPRYLLYSCIFLYNRTIIDIEKSFEDTYQEFVEWTETTASDASNKNTQEELMLSFVAIRSFAGETYNEGPPIDAGVNLRAAIGKFPARFFWHHYDFQNTSGKWSRRLCAGFILIAYGCLALVLLQNIVVVIEVMLR